MCAISYAYFASIDRKLDAYAQYNWNDESTTAFTKIAKVISSLWLYAAIPYLFKVRKSLFSPLGRLCLFAMVPVMVFINLPIISMRYAIFLKVVFGLLLTVRFARGEASVWTYTVFVILFSFQPLYDVFRLMYQSFSVLFELDNLLLIHLLKNEFGPEDFLNY